jgi:hypothetical protein
MRIRFNFVGTRELLKVKNFEIGVARKPDLIEPNCFSSFIRPYQTRIVSPVLVLDCWTVFSMKSEIKVLMNLETFEKSNRLI